MTDETSIEAGDMAAPDFPTDKLADGVVPVKVVETAFEWLKRDADGADRPLEWSVGVTHAMNVIDAAIARHRKGGE